LALASVAAQQRDLFGQSLCARATKVWVRETPSRREWQVRGRLGRSLLSSRAPALPSPADIPTDNQSRRTRDDAVGVRSLFGGWNNVRAEFGRTTTAWRERTIRGDLRHQKLALTGLLFFLNAPGDSRFRFGKNHKRGGAICHRASRDVAGWPMAGGPACRPVRALSMSRAPRGVQDRSMIEGRDWRAIPSLSLSRRGWRGGVVPQPFQLGVGGAFIPGQRARQRAGTQRGASDHTGPMHGADAPCGRSSRWP
jgi:hypothetical protein